MGDALSRSPFEVDNKTKNITLFLSAGRTSFLNPGLFVEKYFLKTLPDTFHQDSLIRLPMEICTRPGEVLTILRFSRMHETGVSRSMVRLSLQSD